uniref:Reverse transcriptase domain-containing protein n=1 Tax=Xenopus tropicalis TaxID=8364 RepID=A0A803J808_XENTR
MLALSTDAEKAFDRVSWAFLRESLAQIGLGHKAIHRIMALYNYPRARIKINGSLSEPFKISNGTRQGCPLSPLLYALVMEHLAIAIRQNCNISGVQIRGNHHETALYADDLLVYITQPLISLPALMQEFREYGEYSNFKINFGKSEALNVSLPTLIQQSLQDHYPFKWSKDSIKYLGINIPADQTKLYQLNQHTLLTQITHDLKSWQPLQLSWFGRIGLIKMNILPRLLYQFQTIPTEPPKSFFDKLNAIFSIFIWAGSKPRINRKILFRQKAKGGLGLPNIKKYWEATVLSRVTEWFQHQKTKRWVQIEQSILDRPLQALWWLPPSQRPDNGLLPIICKETILQADKLLKISPSLIYRTGPLSPIIGNPNFPPGMTKGTFLGKRYNESFVCFQALKDGKLLPLVTICPDEAHTFLAQLKHAQLQHWLMGPGNKQSVALPPTPFEELCLQITPVQHTISILYQLLTASKTTMLPKFTRRWEGELQTHLTGDQWGNCFYLTHKFSIACKAQETNYKIISRWYKCPEILHKIYPTVTNQCWRCGIDIGTPFHIWWKCLVLIPFWEQIFKVINSCTGLDLKPDPLIGILSILPGSVTKYKRSLLGFCLGAARTVIPRHWKSTIPPTINEWVKEMGNVMRMEELLSNVQGTPDKFVLTWSPWVMFLESYKDK